VCGICGKLAFDSEETVLPSVLSNMLRTIAHRGPDGDGIHVSGQVGLGHCRLAIIDPQTGQQPLSNEDDTIWITFNGEIYNYQHLRADLIARGHRFKTRSDTEVIIHLYEERGVGCLEKLRGMFAFALWDSPRKLLLLARDRVGIKPLYYTVNHGSLLFASEIKALLADPTVRAEIAPEMIDRFLTFYYMPGEDTLFRNVRKLLPGYYLQARTGSITVQKYWDLDFSPRNVSFRQASTELTGLFEESVKLHMISDVPIGFLLSGGVDSSAVLGYAAPKSEPSMSSYTLGFSAPGVADERPYASLVARRNGTAHHDLTISAKDFQSFLPRYVWHMEEPVCEPPGIALFFVTRMARTFVKVLLSGEGGDEAFAGYQNYRSLLWLERLKSLLGPFTPLARTGLTALNYLLRSNRVARIAPLVDIPFDFYYYSRTSNPFSFFNSHHNALYLEAFRGWADKRKSVEILQNYFEHAGSYHTLDKMLYVDTKTWLPDDLLVKADKMTMATSVELRVPLLDHKLLEFAASLPPEFKVRRFTTKYIAKKVLEQRVPQEILNRRKTGFSVPYAAWLRNELREWVYSLLLDATAATAQYFNRRVIEQMFEDDYRSGVHARELFSLAALELWHRVFLKKEYVFEPIAPRASKRSGENVNAGHAYGY